MGRNTRTPRIWLLGLALLWAGMAVHANPVEQFTSAAGFRPVDVEALESARYYDAERFPDMGASVFMPDADLPGPVRALLLMDSQEGALPHARYLVNYQRIDKAGSPDETQELLDVTRFNLGPAIHADLLNSTAAEHLADVKVFGEGPHVRWRLVMSPRRGMVAGLDDVSRQQVPDQAAAAMDCLGQPCTTLESARGPGGDWQPQGLAELPPSFRRMTAQGAAPASVLEQLLMLLGEDAQRSAPFAADARRLMFVVSIHTDGQEQTATGLARNTLVFDDAIGAHWVRTAQIADMAAQAQSLMQPRKR